jgi:hypothetical protein
MLGSGFAGRLNSRIPPQKKSCKHHPKVIGACFTVSGRLSVYNTARRPCGFGRLEPAACLRFQSRGFQEVGYVNVPEDIRSKVNFDTDLLETS